MQPDTVYGNRVDQPVSARYDLSRPWAAGERAKTMFALATVEAPSVEVREIGPLLAQIPLFPPRFGYGQDVPTIDDVLAVDGEYGQYGRASATWRYDFSGSPAGFEGSSRPSLGMW